MVKFLTYEPSTSLNVLSSEEEHCPTPKIKTRRACFHCESLEEGYGDTRNFVNLYVLGSRRSGIGQNEGVGVRYGIGALNGEIEDDVFTVKAECLDVALWKIGGTAIVLRLDNLLV